MPTSRPAIPQSFTSKKRRISLQLSATEAVYNDLSPKGSIDEGIRSLVDEVNALEGYVTTSSCAGRVSVFLEGRKIRYGLPNEDSGEHTGDGEPSVNDETGSETRYSSGVGGKGGGGHWLFVAHDQIELQDGVGQDQQIAAMLGMQRDTASTQHDWSKDTWEARFIHFKFEPMILHILTASLEHAQNILSAALQAGFRESGALNLTSSTTEPATPMVAVRSMGLGLESLVGVEENGKSICNVSDEQLETLLRISNSRFRENKLRIQRFQHKLREIHGAWIGEGIQRRKEGDMGQWEDVVARRERKRAEGLQRRASLLAVKSKTEEDPEKRGRET